MIEELPKNILPYLNEYIRKGKRSFIQANNLIAIHDELCRLNNKILDTFKTVSTEHFCVRVTSSNDPDRKIGKIVMKKGYVQYKPFFIEVQLPLYAVSSDFRSIFKTPYFHQEDLRISKEIVKAEFEELLLTLKKKTALDFLNFIKLREPYSKMITAYNKRSNRMSFLRTEIESIWKTTYPVREGMEVTYKDGSTTRTGKVTCVYPKYGHVNILSSSNREINRYFSDCTWENKYESTRLYKCIELLESRKEIPEEWSEKKVDFYA